MSSNSPPSIEADRHLQSALEELAPIRRRLMNHSVYKSLEDSDDLRAFMQHHVFAVWDFMSLLKCLQINLTSVKVPWLPPEDPTAARLINEIVLTEESDALEDGSFTSHFALYIRAMKQCGASPALIEEMIEKIRNGINHRQAIDALNCPKTVKGFISHTFDLIESGSVWAVAAAFTFGREEIIPDMFRNFDLTNSQATSTSFSILRQYLDLHIITDEHHHVPLAFMLLKSLCKDDPVKWATVVSAAREAIAERIKLWDGVVLEIESNRVVRARLCDVKIS